MCSYKNKGTSLVSLKIPLCIAKNCFTVNAERFLNEWVKHSWLFGILAPPHPLFQRWQCWQASSLAKRLFCFVVTYRKTKLLMPLWSRKKDFLLTTLRWACLLAYIICYGSSQNSNVCIDTPGNLKKWGPYILLHQQRSQKDHTFRWLSFIPCFSAPSPALMKANSLESTMWCAPSSKTNRTPDILCPDTGPFSHASRNPCQTTAQNQHAADWN